MTTPPAPAASADGMLAQILAEQRKQSTQLAVIVEQMKTVQDHETRLRVLEQFRGRLVGAVLVVSALFSGLGAWVGVLSVHR